MGMKISKKENIFKFFFIVYEVKLANDSHILNFSLRWLRLHYLINGKKLNEKINFEEQIKK